ncbi:MAG: ATP phosphoribosyltransferase [Alphaproteobacteria bacterium]|nr:ATP phosphoribosyltransferase [Alphaproteobacteria bacterium]
MSEFVIALPKGRILEEINPFFEKIGLIPEDDFFDDHSRLLKFKTNINNTSIIRVRSFDVATFVAFGAAQMGICGDDVLEEFDYSDIYAPIDLKIGKCHMAVAALQQFVLEDDFYRDGHVRVATKYPNITKKYYQSKSIQPECIKLSGAMELAPVVGLCHRIVDVVSTGSTLKANGLVELEHVMDVSSKLIINKVSFKTQSKVMMNWIEQFKEIVK